MNAVEEKAQGFRFAQSEIDDILVECFKSTKLFAKIFFPDRFHLPFSADHERMFAAMDSDEQRVVITAPRGVGKSTLFNLVYPAKLICFRESNLIAQVSHTSTQAEMDSEALKQELLMNENILAVFGSLKPERREEQFSKEAWKSATQWKDGRVIHPGTLVIPRGWGQQVRGIKHNRFRFDKLICDDIEGTEEVMSEDQRRKLKLWFYADLLPSVQKAERRAPGEFPWKVILIGTLLSEDSLLSDLQFESKKQVEAGEKPDWTALHFELCGDDLKSNWAEFMSDEAIASEYGKYERAQQLDVFNKEYRGIPISEATRQFQSRFFHYFDENDLRGKVGLDSVVIVDPARTTEASSCDTAIICWTLDALSGRLYQRDLTVGKFEPDVIYKKTADMARQFKCSSIGIETTGLGEFIAQPFKNFLIHWGYSFEFVELKSRGMKGEKVNRIAGLLPYYRQGRVYHNRSSCLVLEQQLLNFPHSRRLDAADAAAYIVEMLDIGDRFFAPTDTMDELSIEEKFRQLEATYEPVPRSRDDFPGLIRTIDSGRFANLGVTV